MRLLEIKLIERHRPKRTEKPNVLGLQYQIEILNERVDKLEQETMLKPHKALQRFMMDLKQRRR